MRSSRPSQSLRAAPKTILCGNASNMDVRKGWDSAEDAMNRKKALVQLISENTDNDGLLNCNGINIEYQNVTTNDVNVFVLLITLNVGSVFEDKSLFDGWTQELRILLEEKFHPNVVAFNFQEIGGKDSAFMHNLELFIESVNSATDKNRFFSSGLLHVLDSSYANFNALGSLFLFEKFLSGNISVWNFLTREYCPLFDINPEHRIQQDIRDIPFAKSKRFHGTKSRKGFLQTRWKIFDKEIDLINIHLYHDDINTIAVQQTPSIYSRKRFEALTEMVNECELTNSKYAFVFGDFNIRLDGEIIPWLKENYSPKTRKFEPDKREETGEDLLVVGEKMFFFRYPEVFDEKSTIPKLLQFDKEIARFNNSETPAKLRELDITYAPSYCYEVSPLPQRKRKQFVKRIPAWCDRVFFTDAAKTLLVNSDVKLHSTETKNGFEYNSHYGPNSMGDHTPVFLAFKMEVHNERSTPDDKS